MKQDMSIDELTTKGNETQPINRTETIDDRPSAANKVLTKSHSKEDKPSDSTP